MLTFGALVTLLLGLCLLLDAAVDATGGRRWASQTVAAVVCLTLFSGFYTAMVMVP